MTRNSDGAGFKIDLKSLGELDVPKTRRPACSWGVGLWAGDSGGVAKAWNKLRVIRENSPACFLHGGIRDLPCWTDSRHSRAGASVGLRAPTENFRGE